MKKNKIISIRIDDELMNKLIDESLMEDRSISYIAYKHIKNNIDRGIKDNE